MQTYLLLLDLLLQQLLFQALIISENCLVFLTEIGKSFALFKYLLALLLELLVDSSERV